MTKSVEIRRWIKRGIMIINAECLDINDPDNVYNQILSQGQRPEDYGYEHPYTKKYADKSRGQLIQQIEELIKENIAIHRDYATHGRP